MNKTATAADQGGWRCIFAAATQPSQAEMLPKKAGLSGSTCRHQLQAAIGGKKIRLSFSNEHSETLVPPTEPLIIESVHIARLIKAGEPDIDLSSDTPLTFSGSPGVSIPAGEVATSDGVDFEFSPLETLAVTVKFGKVPAFPAVHQEGDCASWVISGDHVSENFTPEDWMWSYFSFCRADVAAVDCDTLVCFGDSITDGAVSTFNGFDAWPDILKKRLQADPATAHISVVNTGIGGNAIWGGWGMPAKQRFRRDALDVPGVKYVIILIGTNDIPGAREDTSQRMIDEYKAMLSACRERGIKVFAGTVTPFGGNTVWESDLHERIRDKINAWMMSEGAGFDGYVDFASAVCDPADREKLKKENDSGDGLHPSANGHRLMGEEAAKVVKKTLLG